MIVNGRMKENLNLEIIESILELMRVVVDWMYKNFRFIVRL